MGRFLKVAFFAGLLVIGLAGAACLEVWRRAGALIADDERWAADAPRRLREKEKQRRRFEWPAYQDFLASLDGPRKKPPFGGIPEDDVAALAGWRASGFPFEQAEPCEDVGFDNRHWPFIFGGCPRPNSLRDLELETIAAQDLTQGGSLAVGFIRTAWELRVLLAWQTLLATTPMSASQLEEGADLLDRLEAARPPLRDQVEGERCLRVRAVLEFYRRGKGPRDFVKGKPDWRTLFSKRMFIARVLNGIARTFAEETAAESLTGAEWIEIAQHRWEADPAKDPLHFACGRMAWTLFWYEARLTLGRQLRRTALAIAWFEAEQGAPPKELAELVPRYLPALKDCPVTGKPFHYGAGRLWSEYDWPASQWEIRPR